MGQDIFPCRPRIQNVHGKKAPIFGRFDSVGRFRFMGGFIGDPSRSAAAASATSTTGFSNRWAAANEFMGTRAGGYGRAAGAPDKGFSPPLLPMLSRMVVSACTFLRR